MLSIQQTAIIVGRRLGLPVDFDGSTAMINDLGMDDKLALTAGIGAEIRANPTEYTAGQVATANSMAGLSGAPLADAGFSIGDWLVETATNADNLIVEPLVGVGQAASSTLKILPLVLLLVAGVIIFSWTKQTAANPPAA